MDGLFKIRRLAYRFAIWVINALAMRLPCNAVRVCILRLTGASIGVGSRVERGVKLEFPWRLRIGENSVINAGAYLDCRGGAISVGNCVHVSSEAIVYTLSHNIYSDNFAVRSGSVELSDGVWIGARAIVLPSTFIGIGSVVGANSVIKGVIADHQLWQGNPALFRKDLPIGRGSNCVACK